MTTEPSEKREYITTPQASELANLSVNYIATLLRKKKLEGFQLGRDWFVYTDSLNQIQHSRLVLGNIEETAFTLFSITQVATV